MLVDSPSRLSPGTSKSAASTWSWMIGDWHGSFSARFGVSKEPFGRNILYYAPWRHFTTVRHSSGETFLLLDFVTSKAAYRALQPYAFPPFNKMFCHFLQRRCSCYKGTRVRLSPVFFQNKKTAKLFWAVGGLDMWGIGSVKFVL